MLNACKSPLGLLLGTTIVDVMLKDSEGYELQGGMELC